ncbi:MAG: MFS transporter, partial [Deltaproteobacteria bacterium]|nr:MFS transporter [Deltaproteobacteria bacterium]
MTVYTAPAIILAPLFGIVADLYGRRLLLACGLLLFGLSGASIALAPTFGWVLTLLAIQGIGFSAVIPLTIVIISDLLEGDREVGGQGLKVFLDRVGNLILPPLGGIL